MKPIRIARVCVVFALCVITGIGGSAGVGEELQPARPNWFVAPLELTPTSRKALPMGGESTIVRPGRGGGPSQKIEVRLQLTWYRYRIIRERGGKVYELPANDLRCYELVSDAPYTWANFKSPVMPVGNFALFSLDDGTSYLCWAYAQLVMLADVTQPRDRIVAFHEYFNGNRRRGPPEVFVARLVPGASRWGGTLLQQEPDAVRILGLEQDAEGALVLTVKDSISPAGAVLVLRDGEWALLHDYPDGLPEVPASQSEPGDPDELP